MNNRCEWAKHPEEIIYHDKEWGFPVHDDRRFFEFIVLESMQAGLSWRTILNKRENMRIAFSDFDPNILAAYTDEDIESLLTNAGIIRNKLKLKSLKSNAQGFLDIQQEFGSFDNYIWAFVDRKPIQNNLKALKDIPVSTILSDKISADLKQRGFKFFGTTICYAFMEATGLVNDHIVNCPLHGEIKQLK